MSRLEVLSDVLHLSKEQLNKTLDPYSVCHLSKQKHLPFKSQNHINDKPFALVHIDTWGPFSVPIVDSFKYFLTIVDDFSRATWVYMLR